MFLLLFSMKWKKQKLNDLKDKNKVGISFPPDTRELFLKEL